MPAALSGAEPGIDAATLYEMLDFKAHSEGQSEYLMSETRFNIACCGRRWGKSQAAGHRMTYKSFVPDSWNWIVGTSYRIGEKEFRVLWDDYQELDLLKHCRKSYSMHQGDMYIHTPWNSHILVVSADNQDSLVGEALSHVIMSEAAKHSQATWEMFVEPGLSDLRGSADFPSTPQGYNYFHGLYLLGQLSSVAPPTLTPNLAKIAAGDIHLSSFAKDYKSWTFPTWENSVRFPGGRQDSEILRVEATASRLWFDQEYAALFTAMEGSIYDEWDEKVHLINNWTFRTDWLNLLMFDYGFANPFVCLDVQIGPNGEAVVWREYNVSGITNEKHAKALSERVQPSGYKVDAMWGDPRDPDAAVTLSENLNFYNHVHQTRGVNYGTVGSMDIKWKLGVEQIKRMLVHRPPLIQVVEGACPNLVRQMNNLHVKQQGKQSKFDLNEVQGDGNIQHKVDDHAADAFRYGIGPHFVGGGGIRLEDILGTNYKGSESEQYILNVLDGHMILEDTFAVRLGGEF